MITIAVTAGGEPTDETRAPYSSHPVRVWPAATGRETPCWHSSTSPTIVAQSCPRWSRPGDDSQHPVGRAGCRSAALAASGSLTSPRPAVRHLPGCRRQPAPRMFGCRRANAAHPAERAGRHRCPLRRTADGGSGTGGQIGDTSVVRGLPARRASWCEVAQRWAGGCAWYNRFCAWCRSARCSANGGSCTRQTAGDRPSPPL